MSKFGSIVFGLALGISNQSNAAPGENIKCNIVDGAYKSCILKTKNRVIELVPFNSKSICTKDVGVLGKNGTYINGTVLQASYAIKSGTGDYISDGTIVGGEIQGISCEDIVNKAFSNK